ncbi:dCMP deaminase [Yersinia phage JC221]|nr:dCMP deaminase [Yersinia phage JC221]
MRSKKDIRYMGYAVLFSQESSCVSTKVGAVLVMDDEIVGLACNNTVPFRDHTCSDKCSHMLNDEGKLKASERPNHSAWSNDNEIHAEMRAIMDAHISGVELKNATLYTTASPCPNCAKHLELYAGYGAIGRIVYLDKYDRGNDEWITNISKHITIDKMERCELLINFSKIITSNNE